MGTVNPSVCVSVCARACVCVHALNLTTPLPFSPQMRNFPAVCDSCASEEWIRGKKEKRNESNKERRERQEHCGANRD